MILICMGTGGVGKTTISAAIAVKEALRGKKVLVMTIDPSLRLKTALKLPEDGEIVEVEEFSGNLFGCVINSKNIFDQFLKKYAPNSETLKKIMQNKLYHQLSTNLSGSQEFTALVKLLEIHESKKFDVIVLDTPPAQHTFEFLQAPEKLTALFQDKITRFLRILDDSSINSSDDKSFLGRWVSSGLQVGTKQVIKILEMMTGSDFISELADFFRQIYTWQNTLYDRSQQAKQLLKNKETLFLIVSSYDFSHLTESKQMIEILQQQGFHFNKLILNRALPEWAYIGINGDLTFGQWTSGWVSYFSERRDRLNSLLEKLRHELNIEELPEINEDISTLQGIVTIAQKMKDLK